MLCFILVVSLGKLFFFLKCVISGIAENAVGNKNHILPPCALENTGLLSKCVGPSQPTHYILFYIL